MRHRPHGSSGGTDGPGAGPKVRRDWLEIVFLGSFLGAIVAFILAAPGLFFGGFAEMAAIDPASPYLAVLGSAIALGYAIFRFFRLWRGEPVPQEPEGQEIDSVAPDAEQTAVPRRNWFLIAFWFSFLAIWSLALLILAGIIVLLVIQGPIAYLPFALFLACGFAVAWIILFQELKSS